MLIMAGNHKDVNKTLRELAEEAGQLARASADLLGDAPAGVEECLTVPVTLVEGNIYQLGDLLDITTRLDEREAIEAAIKHIKVRMASWEIVDAPIPHVTLCFFCFRDVLGLGGRERFCFRLASCGAGG